MKTILKLSILSLFITLSGCSKSDDSINNEFLDSDNVLFAKVIGEDFVSSSEFIGASYSVTPNATAFVLLASDVQSISLSTGKAIGITFSSDKSGFELKSGMVLTPDDPDVFILSGVYAELGFEEYEFVENTNIRLEITNIDTDQKQISGKFSFTAIVENNNGDRITYNVTNGEFKDLLYTDDD